MNEIIYSREAKRFKELFHILEVLESEKFDISKIYLTHQVNGQRKHVRLKDIKQDGVNIIEIIEKYNLNGEFTLGRRIELLRKLYNGSKYGLSTEERKKAEELGVIEGRVVYKNVLEILEILKKEKVDIGNLSVTKYVNGKRHEKRLKDIEGIERIIEKYKLDKEFPIGRKMMELRRDYKEDFLNKEDKEKVEKLGCLEKKTIIEDLLEVLEILEKEKINIKQIAITKTVEGKRRFILLRELNQKGIDINKIINQYELNPDYPLGEKIHSLIAAYKDYNTCAITNEEKRKAEKLGILDKTEKRREDIIEIVEILETLKSNGVDIRKISLAKEKNGERERLLIKDISQHGINISQVIEENNLDGEYPIGYKIHQLRGGYNKEVLNEKDKKRIDDLGIMNVKNAIEELLDILDRLKEEGVNVRRIPVAKRVNGKDKGVKLKDIDQYGVDIVKLIIKYNWDGDYPIGTKITNLRQAYRGVRCKITDEEKKRAELLGVVKIKDMQKEQEDLEKKVEQAKELKKEVVKLEQNKNIIH